MTFPLRPAMAHRPGRAPLRPQARHAARPAPRPPTLPSARALGVPVLLAGLVTAGAPGWASYTIRPGDTLTAIAARYHTTIAELVRANHLPGNGNLIFAGNTLQVPSPRPAAPRSITSLVRHKVVEGDTLIGLAAHYRVSTAAIRSRNHLPASGMIMLGQVLSIPVTRTLGASSQADSVPRTFAGRTYPMSVALAAARNRAALARASVPSPSAVRSLIVSTARRLGVDPNLALAVAWQESGWNQRRVSVANAIGVMQVVPATGDWISSVLGRRLDLLRTEDNVLAGVMLLKVLRSQAGEATAIAGYYQGLASVRSNGMLPDTRRYVASVTSLAGSFRRA